jgi:hypothetical protein
VAADVPEVEDRAPDAGHDVRAPGGAGPAQGGADVLVLGGQAIEPALLLAPLQPIAGLLGQGQVVERVGPCRARRIAAGFETLPGVLADRLQHAEARLTVRSRGTVDQVRLQQGLQAVHDGGRRLTGRTADGLGGRDVPATVEHGQALEDELRLRVQEAVAPGHGGP